MVDDEHFAYLWQNVNSAELKDLKEYQELISDPDERGTYEKYHAHVSKLREKAKCVIPAWDIFFSSLYQAQTRRPWTVDAAAGKQPLLNMDKALQVNHATSYTHTVNPRPNRVPVAAS